MVFPIQVESSYSSNKSKLHGLSFERTKRDHTRYAKQTF